MSRTRQLLCTFYALVAIGALVTTWSQNIAHFMSGRGFLLEYMQDVTVTAASRSFAVDLGFLLLAAVALMVAEARRVGVRFVWLYVILSFAVAISVTFPLFLIAREMRLAKAETTSSALSFTPLDITGLVLITALVLVMSGFILT